MRVRLNKRQKHTVERLALSMSDFASEFLDTKTRMSSEEVGIQVSALAAMEAATHIADSEYYDEVTENFKYYKKQMGYLGIRGKDILRTLNKLFNKRNPCQDTTLQYH